MIAEVYIPNVGVAGSASYEDRLKERLSIIFGRIVPVKREDLVAIQKIWKEQDIGLRKRKIEEAVERFKGAKYARKLRPALLCGNKAAVWPPCLHLIFARAFSAAVTIG